MTPNTSTQRKQVSHSSSNSTQQFNRSDATRISGRAYFTGWYSLSYVVCWCVVLCLANTSLPAADDFQQAETSWLTGNYAEAVNQFEKLITDETLELSQRTMSAVRLSQAFQSTGKQTEAIAAIQTALKQDRQSSRLWAQLAELHFNTGEYVRCQRELRKALDLESQNAFAKLTQAKLLTETGQIKEAMNEYRWFVRHYNRTQPTDWETLMIISEGAAEYARWDRATPIFKFIVNTLCKDAMLNNEYCWQAAVMSGDLLLEKYNQGQALPEFEAALKINPKCVTANLGFADAALQDHKLDIAEGFADKALEINPRDVNALLIKADVQILSDNDQVAIPYIEQALAVNPVDQQIFARQCLLALYEEQLLKQSALEPFFANLSNSDAWELPADSQFVETVKSLLIRNPRPGPFFETIGTLLDARRQYNLAMLFYQAAIDVMPELTAPRTSLGMLAMRTGNIPKAEKILNEAFKADPFHVRVSNMRKVVDLLKSYEVISTDHFVIHIAARDKAIGLQMAHYLEEIYPELVERYGYEPPTRTQFEIYSSTEGQGAHAWFSTRMAGLPWIQTIGASTGMIVALANPTQTQKSFNWARVLRHEFVHILTLQKTNFNIPHWYTEAIAVTEEHVQPPENWQELLIKRVPANDLFTLKTLNTGFQKPKKPSDWTMAYCQSRMYAAYLQERYPGTPLRLLLDAYTDTTSTATAFRAAFNVELPDIESGYRKYLIDQTEKFAQGRRPRAKALKTSKTSAEANPDDAQVLAEYAQAAFNSRQFEAAQTQLDKALDLDPHQPLACAVQAQLMLVDKTTEGIVEVLEAGLHKDKPNALILDLLSQAYLQQEKYQRAEQLLLTATKTFPFETEFYERLMKVGDELNYSDEQLKPILETIAERDYEHISSRKRLARIAVAAGDTSATLLWAKEATYVDALDADMHRYLAKAYVTSGQRENAIHSYNVLDHLGEATIDDRFEYARLLKLTGEKNSARVQLVELLKESPDHAEAKVLLKLMDQGL